MSDSKTKEEKVVKLVVTVEKLLRVPKTHRFALITAKDRGHSSRDNADAMHDDRLAGLQGDLFFSR
jgi:hypothetical protein